MISIDTTALSIFGFSKKISAKKTLILVLFAAAILPVFLTAPTKTSITNRVMWWLSDHINADDAEHFGRIPGKWVLLTAQSSSNSLPADVMYGSPVTDLSVAGYSEKTDAFLNSDPSAALFSSTAATEPEATAIALNSSVRNAIALIGNKGFESIDEIKRAPDFAGWVQQARTAGLTRSSLPAVMSHYLASVTVGGYYPSE